jgi:hypothetical protein
LVDHGVDVASPLDRINVGKVAAAFDECRDRKWSRWERSKLGYRLSRTGNHEMFATARSFDGFATVVA